MSVADSSFDTWLDGYVLGIPNRKVSIYTEGALCAMMLDIYILEKSAGQVSLRSLMTNIYKEYACRGKGLSEEDYIDTLLQYGGSKALAVIENHIYGTKEFSSSIKEVLSIVGLDLTTLENPDVLASSYGLKAVLQKDGLHLKQVQIAAAADKAKMAVGDVITAINGAELTKDLLSSLNTKETITVQLKKRFETIDVKLMADSQLHYPLFKIVPIQDRSEVQKMLFEKWINS
jgi:predicted metalloprotease with PDZ domain